MGSEKKPESAEEGVGNKDNAPTLSAELGRH